MSSFGIGDSRIPTGWVDAISDPENQVYLSVASVWEATIKHQLGKLVLPEPPSTYMPRSRLKHSIDTLQIEESDTEILASLPSHHRDPFDRMIISQAIRSKLVLATIDVDVLAYGVPSLPGVV